MPLISVLIPSYNHAPFVREAIASVLDQTFQDFEIVIVDDASSDNSNEVIAQVKDPRIKHIPLQRNHGACEAMNIGLDNCSGEFIGVCNSDDMWRPTKLAEQLKIFGNCPSLGAVFTDAEWVNGAGAPMLGPALPPYWEVFKQPNRSRFEWIRRLVEGGNCLCHPSILIRREVYNDVGRYNNYLRQLPDFDMWLRVVQRYDIFVSDDKLVQFRLHEANTSRPIRKNSVRDINERYLITRRFFESVSQENFWKAFGAINEDSMVQLAPSLREQEIVSYLLSYTGDLRLMFRQIGCDLLFRSIEGGAKPMHGVAPKEFQEMLAEATVWLPLEGFRSEASTVPLHSSLVKKVVRRARNLARRMLYSR